MQTLMVHLTDDIVERIQAHREVRQLMEDPVSVGALVEEALDAYLGGYREGINQAYEEARRKAEES